MVVAWDLSDASEKEFDKLETKLQEYINKTTLLDEKIAQRRAKILKLTKEIDKLEKMLSLLGRNHCLPAK